ncbi:MAG: PBP1A family penicillin-binding protein [Patescibacteria group bacterium]|nr:PBP1A family penicillin-binding protein [Patescibacteria group bacterium]
MFKRKTKYTNPLGLQEKNKSPKKFDRKKFGKLMLKIMAGLLLFIIILFAWYAKDLPTPGNIKKRNPVESTHIFDRNGKPLYDVFGDVKRTIIDSNQIPDVVKKATIAVEDKDFYSHIGIDLKGIIRAAWSDITHQSRAQGGSTITQQFVKNALLSPKKTFDRKIKELILSLEVEAMYSKDQILVMYLNEIPYGSNVYGIQAASQNYFGKDAKDLDIAEAAAMAAIVKAPTYYSPYGLHPDKFEERKNYVLDRMMALNYISKEETIKAKAEKLSFKDRRENITAPHFVFYVKEKLIEEYGEQMVEEGGLKVTTTLDLDKQKMAEDVVQNAWENKLQNYGASNAALVSMDPKTGQILAMVGSHDYFDKENDGQVNVAISDRQPGSSFKPLVYATAFKGKYNPGYTLFDLTTDFGNYTPRNYDGNTHGPVSMRTALSNSLNIPAVKTLYLAGIDNVLDQVHKMGITTLNDKDRYGLSLVLGGGEVKLVDMVTAYGVFANKGTLHDTTGILKVEDSEGKILFEYKDNKGKKEVLDPQIAYEISDILSDNDSRQMVFGGLRALFSYDRPMAVKTGTTNEYRDAWTIGYTPSVVTGVWVGNNDNSKMNSHADGSMVAAPIWRAYMDKVLDGQPVEKFERPEQIKEMTVAKFSNKLPTDQTKDKVFDIFASWQVPTEYDDTTVKVEICKICEGDKLANDLCPQNEREERYYGNLHSEVPDNPSWEDPVRGWARENGYGVGSPPTETCSLDGETPSIAISKPTANQTVSGNFDITVQTSSRSGIRSVEYYIDNVKIITTTTSPYSTTYNAINLSVGSHKLEAKVTNDKSLTATNSLNFNVNRDSQAPGAVSSVSLSPGSQSIVAKWTNPSDSDLAQVRIYISTTVGSLGNLLADEIKVTPGGVTSHTINNLTSGTTYYLTFRPIDNSGNENGSTTQYSAKPS